VLEHKTVRPHQSLKMATPAERFTAAAPAMAPQTVPAALMTVENKRVGGLVPAWSPQSAVAVCKNVDATVTVPAEDGSTDG
jgi:hypothetical protein